MIQRPITASTHLYRNIKQLVPPVSKLLARRSDSSSSSSNSPSRSLISGTMAAAAAAKDESAASNAQVATSSSSSSQVVIYDPEVLKRTIRGVVFDMDGTLTVPVIDFQYMRQVGAWENQQGQRLGDSREGGVGVGGGGSTLLRQVAMDR